MSSARDGVVLRREGQAGGACAQVMCCLGAYCVGIGLWVCSLEGSDLWMYVSMCVGRTSVVQRDVVG